MTTAQSYQPRQRRLRPASLGLHGGASSLLRLSQPTNARLPAGSDLAQWVQRASASMAPEMAEVADDASPAFITRLQPSDWVGLR